MSEKFNPTEYLRILTKRRKVRENGKEQWVTEEHQYLDVKWRVLWFRQVYPEGYIDTQEIEVTDKYARVEAVVYDRDPGDGGKKLGKGRRQIWTADFRDYIEKAETQAIGRALAVAGFGTQFCDDLDEGDALSDSPIEPRGNGQPGNGKSLNGKNNMPDIYAEAATKGLSREDTNLLLSFKYQKNNPQILNAEEANEFLDGIKNTSQERLRVFINKLRANSNREQVA